jgi:segregation and condensation protein B
MSGMRKKRKERGRAARAEAAAEGELELEAAAEGEGETEAAAETEGESETGSEAEAEAETEGEGETEGEVAAAGEGGADGEGDEAEDLASPERLQSVVESLLFAADKPLTVARLKQLLRLRDGDAIQAALDALSADYAGRGIVLHDVAGGYQLRTHPSNARWVQQLVAGRPVRLTRAQLETLAIVAYRQPITRPEIDEIRGVDSGGTLGLLLERGLIRVLGKKEEPGRPLLYGTTKDFLEFFNLNDLRELPTLREYHELSEDSMREVERLGAALGEAQGRAAAGNGERSAGNGERPAGTDEPVAG